MALVSRFKYEAMLKIRCIDSKKFNRKELTSQNDRLNHNNITASAISTMEQLCWTGPMVHLFEHPVSHNSQSVAPRMPTNGVEAKASPWCPLVLVLRGLQLLSTEVFYLVLHIVFFYFLQLSAYGRKMVYNFF